MGENFKSHLQKIEKLPTLSETAIQILNLTNDPLLSIDELKNILERDPAISAKILSVANSAFSGFPLQTNALGDAIMRIGFNNVKSIALGISVMTLLDNGKSTAEYKRLFNHSVTVGLTSRVVAKNLRTGIADNILIEAMLHDLGYLVLNRYFPEIFQEILSLFENEASLLDAEKNILSCTHSDIGFWLAEKWNMPDTILDAILYHHIPSLAGRNAKRVAIIHIADYIVSKNIISPIEKDTNYPLDPCSIDMLGISNDDLKGLAESIGDVLSSDKIFSSVVR